MFTICQEFERLEFFEHLGPYPLWKVRTEKVFHLSIFFICKKQTYKELRNVEACQRKPTELKRSHIKPVFKLDHFTVVGQAREGCGLSTLAFE